MILLCCPLQKLLTKALRKGVLQNVCSQNTKATGDTPLHLAVSKGDKGAVEILLPGPSQRNTVDTKDYICAQNNHGKTPVHIAAEGNHHEWVLTVYTGSVFVYVLANKVFTVGICLEARSQSCSAPVKISHAWAICTWTLSGIQAPTQLYLALTTQVKVYRGSVATLAGPALAGPLFRESLVSFPDCIGTHVLLKQLNTRRAAASDMAHSAACSSSAFKSSPTRRPIMETPHHAAPPRAHARVIFYLQWGPTTFEMPAPPLVYVVHVQVGA